MFLGGIINRVAASFNTAKTTLTNALKNTYNIVARKQSGSSPHVGMEMNMAEAAGTAFAAINVFQDPKLIDDIMEEIGQRGVEIVREKLQPVTRSGATADSFDYRLTPDGVEIFSNDPQAAALQEGIKGRPPRDKLVAWLKTKPEHAYKQDKELQRLGFLIQRSITLKRNPGKESTLAMLKPQGKRSMDYVTESAMQLMQEVNRELSKKAF